MGVLLGLDIGTTKICALALDAESGSPLAIEDAYNDTQLPVQPDAAEQDPKSVVRKSFALLKTLLQRPELADTEVLGIGVTGQMHGVCIIDADGEPITPLVTWQDRRGTRPYQTTGRTYAEELAARLGEDAVESSGCAPATGYGGVTLLRMREEATMPKSGRALTIHDFVVHALCGAAVTDPTDAASWGIFDVRDGGHWLRGAVDALRLPDGMLPEVQPTGTIAGKLTPEAAQAIGLKPGVPVAVAFGDNQASFVGSVPSLRDTLLMNLGTGGQMSAPVGHFTRAFGLDTRPLTNGAWLLVGASLCGGRAYQVLELFYASVGRDLFGIHNTTRLYDQMNDLAAEAKEDCGGLMACTMFEGTRLDSSSRGSIQDLDTRNFTAGNLTRAIVIGMVEELVEFFDVACKVGATPAFLAGSGNAVRRNATVRLEIEKRVNMRLRMPPHAEEAAVGAALAGGVAAGVYPDWQAAGETLYRDAYIG